MNTATILEQAVRDVHVIKLGNLKDPEKIKEKQAKYWQDIVDNAALDATTATVLCIGLYYPNKEEFSILQGEEKAVLTEFWTQCIYPKRYVGFNILAFDLPFIVRRCWHLDITVPAWVFDGRYFSKNFVDLMQYWQLGDRYNLISLDKLSRFVGLEGKGPNGKLFHILYQDNREEAIKYLQNDLRLTAQVYRRLMVSA